MMRRPSPEDGFVGSHELRSQVYPAHFCSTYPLAFVCGLAGMYALRSEVHVAGLGLLAVAAVGAVGFGAGWDIARGPQKLAAGDKHTDLGIPRLFFAALSLPLFFLIKGTVGTSTGLWFCALAFACMPVGFVSARLIHRTESD